MIEDMAANLKPAAAQDATVWLVSKQNGQKKDLMTPIFTSKRKILKSSCVTFR